MNGLATYAWVAVGGGLGSMARFWMTGWVAEWADGRFPWGTLLINSLGSLVIGVVAGLTLTPARIGWHPDVRIFLMAGVCGGFTTFSAFSLQSVELIQGGDVGAAFFYVAASVVLCLAATWAGMLLVQ
jgi:CrcB protein